MKKLNLIVDILSFFAGLMSLFSGIVIWKILPQGQGFQGGRGELEVDLFIGITRHTWTDIHNIFSLIFITLIIIHLIFHWRWIKNLPTIFRQ